MNFIRIIKEFFEKLNNKNTKLIEENKNNSEKDSKEDFKESIDFREKQEILELQKRFENNEISPYELSIYQLMGLTDLYREQIDELNKALEEYNNS